MAATLAAATPEEAALEIDKIDEEIAGLARLIRNPGWLIRVPLFVIRLGERRSIRKVIDTLS